MQIHLWCHSGTQLYPISSLLHDFFNSGTVGPSPAKLLPYMQIHPWWHCGTHLCPISSLFHKFFCSGTVGPASSLFPPNDKVGPSPAKLLPYFMISSLVVQWGLPTILFRPSDTMGPSLAKIHIYIQIHPWWHSGIHLCSTYSLLHNFFPSGTMGPASFLVLPNWHSGPHSCSSQVPPQWYSGTHPCHTSFLHANLSLVAQWVPFLPNFFTTSQFLP